MKHGGSETPPSRLCACGHTYKVHRAGTCRIVTGCDCQQFTEHTSTPLYTWWGPTGRKPGSRRNMRPTELGGNGTHA